MAIDFCTEKIGTYVTCGQISQDGYEVTNLISLNPNLKSKGFRAEYFIQGPIEIILTFPFPLDLRRIVMGLRSGCIGTSVLDLSVASHFDCDEFKFMGKYSSNDLSLVLVNPTYKINNWTISKGIKFEEEFPSNSRICFFPNRFQIHCSDVIKLKIRLISSLHSSSYCLNSLSVVGQPSTKITQINYWKLMIDEKFVKFQERQENESPKKINFYGTDASEEKSKDLPLKKKIEFPLEFLDIITHEVMTLPLRLPSGHFIDQKTLDQYVQYEAEWGRPPNDPFTKICFNSDYKPIPDIELKIKIDQFHQNHSSESNQPHFQ